MWFVRICETIISDIYEVISSDLFLFSDLSRISASFLAYCSSLFHFRFFLPVVLPCHESSFFLKLSPPHSGFRGPAPSIVISHRSFILFHASGTSVHWYLLTINKTRGRYALSLSSIFILHPFLPTHLLHAVPVANPWEILHAANFAICLFSFPSPLSRYLPIRFFFLHFLLWHLIWFLLCLNNLHSDEASSYSSSHLSTIALFIYILWSRRLELLFSLSWILLASYYSARLFFRKFVYRSSISTFASRFFRIFPICLKSFSFSPAIGFATRPPFLSCFSSLRAVYSPRRNIRPFNFFRTLSLFVFTRFTQTASYPQAFYFYAPHFWKFLFFDLCFPDSSFFPLHFLFVTFHLPSSITLILIHLS